MQRINCRTNIPKQWCIQIAESLTSNSIIHKSYFEVQFLKIFCNFQTVANTKRLVFSHRNNKILKGILCGCVECLVRKSSQLKSCSGSAISQDMTMAAIIQLGPMIKRIHNARTPPEQCIAALMTLQFLLINTQKDVSDNTRKRAIKQEIER